MRWAYTALMLGLLVLQKDPSGEPPLDYRPWPGRPCQEQSGLWRLQNTFGWQPDLGWVAESPWGSCLAGVAMVLLWALLESWAASCLTSLHEKLDRSAAGLETETARETDLEIPRRKSSLRLGRPRSTSGSQRYHDPPSERHRRSLVTFEGQGKRRWGEVLYPEYRRSRSSCSSTQRSLQDRSSSLSSSSSSSSSSSASFCLPRLKNLDFFCASGDPSSATCSLETLIAWTCGPRSQSTGSESGSSESCYAPPDSSLQEEECPSPQAEPAPRASQAEPAPRASLLILEQRSETQSASFPLKPREVQTQTSFATINIVQTSAYTKKDRVFLVEKSLQVQMGGVRLPRARPPLPRLFLAEDAGKRGRPATLSVLALASLPRSEKTRKSERVASLCGLLGAFERAAPNGSSQGRERSGLEAIFADASPPDGFARVPSVTETVDRDTWDFLEFHVKKKMVQWTCGMPSVVSKSVAAFHSPAGLCRDKPASDRPTPRVAITLTSRKRANLALHVSPHAVVGTYSSEEDLELKAASLFSFLSFLSSWEPEDIHRLAFHAAVKGLEIKTGAFPEMVGDSFQQFWARSKEPLPKVIHSGNKILKSKHPSLPFLAQENVCILDLNVKRKWLADVGNFSITFIRVAATEMSSTVASVSSQLRASEEDPREKMAQLFISIWRQIHTVGILYFGSNQSLPLRQSLPLPLPWLDSSASSAFLSLSAEASPEMPFPDGPLKTAMAPQVPAGTPRPLEDQLLGEGRGGRDQEKPSKPGPGQRALALFFDPPDSKSATSRKAMKFRAETSIVRTSLLLELELKKEKLNLHLKKKMRTHLRPLQGAALELTVEPRRRARASPAPQQARSSPQPLGRPRRSFCYVCMPSDESSTELKTVCWSLPRWILKMNGYRTPEVARFAHRSRTPQPVQK